MLLTHTVPNNPKTLANVAMPIFSDFEIRGHSKQCSSIIALKDHLLIGISPFNSRFSSNYVRALLSWGLRTFSQVDVLLPDEHSAAALLIATGNSETKALRKTRKELNRHRRSVQNAIDQLGEFSSRTRVFDFSQYFSHAKYVDMRAYVEEAFDNCASFRSACLDMSMQAICGRSKGIGNKQDEPTGIINAATAARYIFAELPFYLCSPDLLGAQTSVLAYHREWPIGDALLSGQFPLSVDPRQAHGIVSIT